MDGEFPPEFLEWEQVALIVACGRDIYRSSNIVIQDSVINNGDGMANPAWNFARH